MKVTLCISLFLLLRFSVQAQLTMNRISSSPSYVGQNHYGNGHTVLPPVARKLFQRNHGMIIGLQRGMSTAIELGGEAHWRKIAFRKPHVTGASVNMEYNFGDHVIGYKAGMWVKRGRVNLTYGANLAYFTNFKGKNRYGGGPAVGFRLAGFHLINGYNFLAGDKELDKINTLYMTLRYYFPLESKFTWDRKTMKKKENRKRDRAKKKKQREREKESGEKKGLRKLFDF